MARNIKGSKDGETIEPSDGKTKLAGGRGDDRYIVKDAETLVIERNNGGTDTVEAWLDYALTDEVENLELHGPDALKGTGNSLDNRLSGNEWDNQLFGLQGDDELYGAGGNDVLEGGDGFDTAVFDGPSSDYQIEVQDDFIYVRYAPDGEVISTDTLKSVEILAFEDGTILVSDLQAEPSPADIPAGPVAEADYAEFDEDTEIVIDLLANDSGSNLAIMSIGTAQMGEVSLEAGGLVRYTPFPDAFGQDSFDYTVIDEFGNTSTSTVTLEVLPVNDAPEASGEAFEVDGSIPYESIDSLLDNDTDPDGDEIAILSYEEITSNGGTVTVNEDGTFTYQPSSAYDANGEPTVGDSFNYVISDGHGGTSTASVDFSFSAPPIAPSDATSEAPQYALEALLSGGLGEDNTARWNADQQLGSEVVIRFCFLQSVPDYYSGSAYEREAFEPFSEEQKLAALEAFAQVESFTNITFLETSDPESAQISFGTADLPTSAWAYSPSTLSLISGDVWINNTVASNSDLEPGGDGYMRIFHEIGHALGLEHPHEGEMLPADEDSRQFTLMSYSEHEGTAGVEPGTYMTYDIAALQHLYGEGSSNSGDDTYQIGQNDEFVGTIWDSSGHDILDASSATSSVRLDLNPGSFSTVGDAHGWYPMENNLAIAYGTTIEDAIGGAANDTLIGNDVANRLDGGEGNDGLTGGAGADIFSFGASWGQDTITDFEDGVDRLHFANPDITLADLTLSETGDGLYVSNEGDEIFLAGLTLSDFDETDLWSDDEADATFFAVF